MWSIYLDNNSTTKIYPEVVEEMMPYLQDKFGNPGTQYGLGRETKNAVDKARAEVAELINAKSEQIIFTSGGTESNNMAFESTKDYLMSNDKTIIITDSIEHDSLIKSVKRMEIKHGFDVVYLPPDKAGKVEIGLLEEYLECLGDKVGMVSIMGMNNETGVKNDIGRAASICDEKGVLFHTDCVQALSCMPIDVEQMRCDFLSMSGHKIHAPKGIGALYVRDKSKLSPMVVGGSYQEFGLRGGTENVASIVGFGTACRLLKPRIYEDMKKYHELIEEFSGSLKRQMDSYGIGGIVHYNAEPEYGSKTINLRFNGIDSETLLLLLDSEGIYISSGSACRSLESTPSRVLTAMGLSADESRCSIRISFSADNNAEDIQRVTATIASSVTKILSFSKGRKL